MDSQRGLESWAVSVTVALGGDGGVESVRWGLGVAKQRRIG